MIPTLYTRCGTEVDPAKVSRFDPKKGAGLWLNTPPCYRCGGAGGAEQWRHTGYTCFDCGGSGKAHSRLDRCYTAERLEKLDASAAKRAAKRAAVAAENARARRAELDAVWDQWAAASHAAFEVVNFASLSNNDLMRNICRHVTAREPVPDRMVDVALSMIVAKLAEADARAASAYIGEIGKRADLTLTIERVLSFESTQYGWPDTYLHLMRDQAGNRVIYKGSKKLGGRGETIRVRATIKEHDNYNDEKQTTIARPAITETETT